MRASRRYCIPWCRAVASEKIAKKLVGKDFEYFPHWWSLVSLERKSEPLAGDGGSFGYFSERHPLLNVVQFFPVGEVLRDAGGC